MSTSAAPAPSDFYVLQGALKVDAPSYVQRQADVDLYDAIKKREFCYVLTSRQMGKSSLMVRAAVALRREGTRVAVLDLNAVGTNLTVQQWYQNLIDRLAAQLGLEDQVEQFCGQHSRLSPLQLWAGVIQQVVLADVRGPVVIFIDEIDQTRSLPFSADEFFANIRSLYQQRTESPDLERLTFCLLGTATPTDLIHDPRTTPFNIGTRIDLADFTMDEAQVLLQGLGRTEADGLRLLYRVLYWTGGHPYLTQRLCQAVGADKTVAKARDVDRVCSEIFLTTAAQERDDNLLFVRDRMLRSSPDPVPLLTLYSQVIKGPAVKNESAHPLMTVLRLAGVVRVDGGYLRASNRVYQRVFDKNFVRNSLPLDERERQRLAERSGRRRVLAVAIPIVLAFFALAVWALKEQRSANSAAAIANAANVEAQRLRTVAENEQQNAEARAKEANALAGRLQLSLSSEKKAAADAALAEMNLKKEKAAALEHARNGLNMASDLLHRWDQSDQSKDPAALKTQLRVIGIADDYADTVLQLDPDNERAADIKGLVRFSEADAYKELNDTEKLQESCHRAAEFASRYEHSKNPRLKAIAARTYGLSAVGMYQDNPQWARTQIDKAHDIVRELGPTPISNGDSVLDLVLMYEAIATVELLMENDDRAIQEYQAEISLEQEAIKFELQTSDIDDVIDNQRREMKAWNQVGEIQLRQKKYQQARVTYDQNLLKVADEMARVNENPDYHRSDEDKNETRVTMRDILGDAADTLSGEQQMRDEALKYHVRSVVLGEQMAAGNGGKPDSKLEEGVLSVAKFQVMTGHFPEALASYKKYVALVKTRATKVRSSDNLLDLATAYRKIAEFESRHGMQSAALADYQHALEVLPDQTSDYQSTLKVAIIDEDLADLESAMGKPAAKEHYSEAAENLQSTIDLLRKLSSAEDSYLFEDAIEATYEELIWPRLALGDHEGAASAMNQALKAARAKVAMAREEFKKDNSSKLKSRLKNALGSLGWVELLNGHLKESMDASQEALKLNEEPWIDSNLADAYLLSGRFNDAWTLYEANKGEEVNDELFEDSVREDFDKLRKLGLGRPDMKDIEARLAN